MNYLLPLISFVGLFVGNYLYKVAKEEIWYGKFWFLLMQKVLLLSIIGSFIYFFEFNYWVILGFILGLVLAEFFNLWSFLGFSLLSSYFISSNVLFLVSSLIFIYGLPVGTLMRKVRIEEIFYLFLCFIIPFIFYFGVDFVGVNFFVGLGVGGILRYVIGIFGLRKLFK